MICAVFKGEGRLEVEQKQVPRVGAPDDVLLEVEAAGICGTDVHILSVPPGHPANTGTILGHEYVGRVVDAGDEVTGLKIGDRVVVDPNITCDKCNACRRGIPNMCENMTTLGIFINGGFAEYNLAPARSLYKISTEVDLETAVFAEPLSCVVNGFEKLKFSPGESAVILGAGPIGLLFALMFKAAGVGKLIISEPLALRRKYAERCGADKVVDPTETDISEIVLEETGGGAGVVVDCVGNRLGEAISLARRGGHVLLFGMNQRVEPPVKQYNITRNELTVSGTYISRHSFPKTVQLLESGLLDLKPLITHRLSIEQIHDGISAMRESRAVKAVIFPHGTKVAN